MDLLKLTQLTAILNELEEGGGDPEFRMRFAELIYPIIKAAVLSVGSFSGDYPLQFSTVEYKEVSILKDWLRAPEIFVRDFVSDYSDLSARISGFLEVYIEDLTAAINPFTTSDLLAYAGVSTPVSLYGDLSPIPSQDLIGNIQTIPGADLRAFAGAHDPVDLTGYLGAHLPVDLSAFLRSGDSGQDDLGADLTQIGYYNNLPSFVRSAIRDSLDLTAKLIIRTPVNLTASLHGYVTNDLPASIITQRIKDLVGIIRSYHTEVYDDFLGSIRPGDSGQKDLPVEGFKAVVSTNTSGNKRNVDKVATSFFNSKFIFGSKKGGAFKFTVTPTYGDFPDLHADISAKQFAIARLLASVRPLYPDTSDLNSSSTAVVPYINLNRIDFNLTPLKNLTGTLIQVGGFKPLYGIVKPVHKAQTGTSPDAGYSTKTTSFRFILGTSGGIFLPQKAESEVITDVFTNNHRFPDLHASLSGWVESSLTAYIKTYEFSEIKAGINALDFSHINELSASIASFREANLTASVASSGAFSELTASTEVGGAVSDLTGFIEPYVNPKSYNLYSLSTKPFRDLTATVNYDPLTFCATGSAARDLPGYLRPIIGADKGEPVDLYADVTSLSDRLDLEAEVTARKRTRIRTLSLSFRTGIRNFSDLKSLIYPTRVEFDALNASIVGLSHTSDLRASVTPTRYLIQEPLTTLSENVVRLEKPSYDKDILVSFRSSVSSYIFEEASNMVYPTDRGTWAIDLTLDEDRDGLDFAEAQTARSYKLDDIEEYNSIDEAIRAAIVLLTEQRSEDLAASINPVGSVNELRAYLKAYGKDNYSDLSAKVVTMNNIPDLYASINIGTSSSSLRALSAIISSVASMQAELNAEIEGVVVSDLTADLNVV